MDIKLMGNFKNLIPTFNLLLQACAGAERRQKRHKLLEVEPIQHPQEPLIETKQHSIAIYQGTTLPRSHNSLVPSKTLNVACFLAPSILGKTKDIAEMEESGPT